MLILIALLIIASVALAVYALMLLKSQPASEIQTQADILSSEPLAVSETGTEPFVSRLEEQVNSLSVELQKIEEERKGLHAELELTDKLVIELKQGLSKLEEIETAGSGTDKVKEETTQLKEELINKSEELGQKITEGINLTRQLQANNEEKAKEIKEGILSVQEKIFAYTKEVEKYRQTIEGYKQEGKGVSQEDYERLSSQLKEETDKVEALKKENSDLHSNVKVLETQISEYKEEIDKYSSIKEKQETGGWIPREEFEQLKKKLEAAEEVLRIVHGSR